MTKYVMRSAQSALPDALIEYLFDLALENPETDVQTFRLYPDERNSDVITNVEHTIYRSDFNETHQLFGFHPVCATVTICFDGIGYNMSLAAYKPLYEESGAAACSSLQYQTSTI